MTGRTELEELCRDRYKKLDRALAPQKWQCLGQSGQLLTGHIE